MNKIDWNKMWADFTGWCAAHSKFTMGVICFLLGAATRWL